MNCIACDSDRMIAVSGKCSDRCVFRYKDNQKDGYVPENMGIGGGKYIEFELCVDCGRLQGHFPILEEQLEGEFSND